MDWFRNLRELPIARRTALLLAPALLILVLVIATSLWLVAQTPGHTKSVEDAIAFRFANRSLLLDLQDAETGQRGYLLTREPKYLEPYTAGRARALARFETLKSLMYDERLTPVLDELKKSIDAKFAELDQTTALAKNGQQEEALSIVRSNRGKELMDLIRAQLDEITVVANARTVRALSELKSNASSLAWAVGFGGVAVAVFAIAAIWIISVYVLEIVGARQEIEGLNAGLEQRVKDRTGALSQANDEIQRFAYIVSHDLRAPLVNIMGFSSELSASLDVLKRYFAAPNEGDAKAQALAAVERDVPESLRFINVATERMDRLINAILRLSREGRRDLTPEPVNLKAALESAALAVQHQLNEAGGTATVSGPDLTITSDRLALDQVFGNMIDNAVKFLATDRPGKIDIRLARLRHGVEVTIADNGRGIAERDHDRIFELFRRSGAQDRPGEGLGLAHTRALVRRLGGYINLTSKLGEGTTFRINLPFELEGTGVG